MDRKDSSEMYTRRFAMGALLGAGFAGGWRKLQGAEPYSGPRPPKKDLPYLLHADNLIPTEPQMATTNKDGSVYTVSGATSPARTPLAEPIFLIATDQLSPENLALYRFEVKNGSRELDLSRKRKRKGDKSGVDGFHISSRQLAPGLFRVEAAEYLENGEYSLSPEGQNIAFCFTVY